MALVQLKNAVPLEKELNLAVHLMTGGGLGVLIAKSALNVNLIGEPQGQVAGLITDEQLKAGATSYFFLTVIRCPL